MGGLDWIGFGFEPLVLAEGKWETTRTSKCHQAKVRGKLLSGLDANGFTSSGVFPIPSTEGVSVVNKNMHPQVKSRRPGLHW